MDLEDDGAYAPFACAKAEEESSDEEELEAPPAIVAQARLAPSVPTPVRETASVSVVLARLRKVELRTGSFEWFEFLLEKRGKYYQFPQGFGSVGSLLTQLVNKKQIFTLTAEDVLRRHFDSEVVVDRTTTSVFMMPFQTTRKMRRDQVFTAPPRFYWVCESEMATHSQVGPPSAFGVTIAPWALSVFYRLPVHKRFATAHPPLVLYHGTERRHVASIAEMGLKPKGFTPSMVGTGVYFARWEKALDFARHDALYVVRAEPGVVVRCFVFCGSCVEMTSAMRCTCGCGKSYVDHNGVHTAGYRTVFIPDNSLGAAKRAEWCVKEPDAIAVDGFFTM